MPRSFGGGNDYSGVFANLAEQDLQRIRTGTREAANQAAQDQNAIDEDVHSKWKNGQITDDEWLAHLRQRIEDAGGDPEEQAKWRDMLREHTGAIADAQVETKFRLGKITAQALLTHYRSRMSGVAENSPAFREIAARYQDLVDYVQQGGGSSGGSSSGGGGRRRSSGGGGGGGGGGGESVAGSLYDQNQGSTGGPHLAQTPGGLTYDPSGPNVIDPLGEPGGSLSYYIKTLEADADRIKDMVDQYKKDPFLKQLVDNATGQTVPVSIEMLRALDNQFLRNQELIAQAYEAKNDPKKATAARTAKGTYVSSYMVDHNTDRLQPTYSLLQEDIANIMRTASELPPDQAAEAYQQAGQMVKDFTDGAFPGMDDVGLRATLGEISTKVPEGTEATRGKSKARVTRDLPAEARVNAGMQESLTGLGLFFEVLNNPNLSDEERIFYASEAERMIPGRTDPTGYNAQRGNRDNFTAQEVHEMLYADPTIESRFSNPAGRFGVGFRGGLANIEMSEGLDNNNPEFPGRRFLFQLDPEDGSSRIVAAEAAITPTGAIRLVPEGAEISTLVPVRTKVGGRVVTSWADPTRIPRNLLDPKYLVYQATREMRFDGGQDKNGNDLKDIVIPAGGYVPTEMLTQMGPNGIASAMSNGEMKKESPFFGVMVAQTGGNAPRIYYQDPETRLLSPRIPMELVDANADGVPDAITVDLEGRPNINPMPYAKGSPVAWGEGISASEKVATLRGMVNDGSIDLSTYRSRGAGGVFVDRSPTLTELTLPLAGGPRGWGTTGTFRDDNDDIGDRFETSAREEGRAFREAHRVQAMQQAMGETDVPSAADNIRSFSQSMGINVSPGPLDPQTRGVGQVEKVDNRDLAVRAREEAQGAANARRFPATAPSPMRLTAKPLERTLLPEREARDIPPVVGRKPAPLAKRPAPARTRPKPVQRRNVSRY